MGYGTWEMGPDLYPLGLWGLGIEVNNHNTHKHTTVFCCYDFSSLIFKIIMLMIFMRIWLKSQSLFLSFIIGIFFIASIQLLLIYINNITILQYSSCVLMLVFASWPFGHSGVRYELCGCLTIAPIYFSVHNTHYTWLP